VTSWATKAQARGEQAGSSPLWADAVSLSDDTLDYYLTAATEQCQAYAPALAEGQVMPNRYILGCIYQARELYAASTRGESDVIGVGDFAIRARPLTAAVRQLLRPHSPSFTVG
jgi:hypothetical protein